MVFISVLRKKVFIRKLILNLTCYVGSFTNLHMQNTEFVKIIFILKVPVPEIELLCGDGGVREKRLYSRFESEILVICIWTVSK